MRFRLRVPIKIYGVNHSDAESYRTRQFLKQFKRADVLFLEKAGKDRQERTKRVSRMVSRNGVPKKVKITTYDAQGYDAACYFLNNVLAGSKKTVFLEESPYSERYVRSLMDSASDIFIEYALGMPEDSFRTARKYIQKTAKLDNARNEAMVRRLAGIQERNKDKNVLAILGFLHAEPVASALRNMNYDAEWLADPQCMHYLNAHIFRAIGEVCAGKDPTDLAISKISPDEMLTVYLDHASVRPESFDAAHKAVEKIDYKESCELSHHVARTFKRHADIPFCSENIGAMISRRLGKMGLFDLDSFLT